MKPGRAVIRIISSLVAVVYFATNCLLIHASEANIWADRKKTSLKTASPLHPKLAQLPLHLPSNVRPSLLSAVAPEFGTIRNTTKPAHGNAKRTLIHIQDVHLNFEAQVHISRTIRTLLKEGSVDLVAVEGAYDPFNKRPFSRYPYPSSIEAAADALLRQNIIAGPYHAFLTAKGRVPFVGVDSPALYAKNLTAYRSSATRQLEYDKKIDIAAAILGRKKK